MTIELGYSLVGGQEVLEQKLTDWGYVERNDDLQGAIAEYQEVYRAELDPLAEVIHGRPLDADGTIGPATARVINARFCSVPDFANAEEARWPDSCKDDITVSYNFESLPGATPEETRDAFEVAHRWYNDLFEIRLVLVREQFPNTRIWARLKPLPGGTLAWSFLANNSCSFRAEQAYDSTVNWRSKVMRQDTIAHEEGHALGMHHTPNDPQSLMYPSMRGQDGLNQTDINNMLRLGYKRRTSPLPPTDPPGDEKKVLFEYTAKRAGEKISLVTGQTGGGIQI